MSIKPVVEGLFEETGAGPRLVGSRCKGCGRPFFPRARVCNNPDCETPELEDARFGPRGTIFAVAVQNYPPPAPSRFDAPYRPYALGLVDLEEGLRVFGQIKTADPMSVACGMAVELVLDPLCHEEDGTAVITWKFEPRETA